jgi:hypothetical protein
LDAASFTGIGTFSSATLGFFDRERMDYKKIAVDEQVEVLTLAGNIASTKTSANPKCMPTWWSAVPTAPHAAAISSRRTSGQRSRWS